jgi:hypothetical protein
MVDAPVSVTTVPPDRDQGVPVHDEPITIRGGLADDDSYIMKMRPARKEGEAIIIEIHVNAHCNLDTEELFEDLDERLDILTSLVKGEIARAWGDGTVVIH